MNPGSIWPPRRLYDRAAFELYQRRHPEAPWLPKETIELLNRLLRRGDNVLEWGSGRSSAWIGKQTHTLRTIEHDRVWFDQTDRQLKADGLSQVTLDLLSPEPRSDPAASPYVRVIDEFADGSLDVIFVDGEHRAACTLGSIPKLAAGGLLILDDAHNFLDHPSASPGNRYQKGHAGAQWSEIATQIAGWRQVWVTDGYSDTAIWFKP